MRIHKGDQVIVRSGKDKGKKAEVVRAFPATERVILEGVNVAKRHAKPTRATQQAASSTSSCRCTSPRSPCGARATTGRPGWA